MATAPVQYHAFVSYTHHDDSVQIADLLFRKMEGYTLPLFVRLRVGFKKFGKVFVDHHETSHDDSGVVSAIRSCIDCSETVIALCSLEYKKSQFSMEHEIAYAQQHNKRIVAVLLDGVDALPDAFLDEERTVVPNTTVVEWSAANREQSVLRVIAAVLNFPYATLARHEALRKLLTTGYSAVAIWGCISIVSAYLALGLFHIHLYVAATCTRPKICVVWVRHGLLHIEQCGESSGLPLGHTYAPLEETEPCQRILECSRCGKHVRVVNHEYEEIAGNRVCGICGIRDEERMGE